MRRELDLDREFAIEMLDTHSRMLEDRRAEMERVICVSLDDPLVLRRSANPRCSYGFWCRRIAKLYTVAYALEGDVEQYRRGVLEAIARLTPYVQQEIAYGPCLTERERAGYDYGALADVAFVVSFALYVAMEPRGNIVKVCEDTNYGRYTGRPSLNQHASIFCRMMRAYFLDDSDWLQEEVEHLRTCTVEREVEHLAEELPKARWHPLFHGLFFGDRESFNTAARGCSKWYNKRLWDDFRKGKSLLTTPNGYNVHNAINIILLAAIKIANTYRGYDIQLEDQFVPMELINLSREGAGTTSKRTDT
jgi:hypothetical protein